MKNANGKGFDKDRRQSSSSQYKGQDKGKKDAKEGGQYTVPIGPKCFGCQGFRHMKYECPTYLKSIGKSKALAATLSDTEPEDDSDNEDDGILNAFTATIDPTNGIVEDVIEAIIPKALRSYGNSVLTTFLSILLPFVLSFKLRTRLPTVLVEAFSICVLHKLLELPGDIGLHLGIFIIIRP